MTETETMQDVLLEVIVKAGIDMADVHLSGDMSATDHQNWSMDEWPTAWTKDFIFRIASYDGYLAVDQIPRHPPVKAKEIK